MRYLRSVAVLLGVAALVTACGRGPLVSPRGAAAPPDYGYRVVKVYPHDSRARTQGLIFRDGFLFESTGQQGGSTLRKVRLESGHVSQQRRLDSEYFAEGLTDWGDGLVQLTWRSRTGIVWDTRTLRVRDTFAYSGEGWGLTHDGRRLIMSDGSSTLRFLDPTTYRVIARVVVREGAEPVGGLNELEYVRGEIFANVWRTNKIARVNPRSGQVTGWVDLSGLLPETDRADSGMVLNGIAFDKATGRLFVTGKRWPKLFEIRLVRG